MPVKYVPYYPSTVQGQAILNNITRTRRVLRYRDNNRVYDRIQRGMPYYELEKIESVGNNPDNNMLIRGECISACAYLKDKGIQVDLVYIDPPFASGADYAKKVYIRRNPKIAKVIAKAEEELEFEELRAFEEKMYGDIWNKEDYLNWMYENLTAIKSVMSETASIYVHLDPTIGHYVKVLMDEVLGEGCFVNEIIWHYAKFAGKSIGFHSNHDCIYYYKLYEDAPFNKIRIPVEKKRKQTARVWDSNLKKAIQAKDENGNLIYYDQTDKGVDDTWIDIPLVNPMAKERSEVDYSTQKPEFLLKRIIETSSNNNMIVADFFGGSGVTAKVAHDLKRKFIHCDIGINSIQTTRDRLIANGAKFDIYEIQDGVSLFRNPVQTMDKLKSLINGLKNEDALDSFWEGGIQDSKLGLIPVYIPNLLDHSTKMLDIPLINRVINEAMPDLPEGTRKVIVFYVDIENENALKKFISENNATGIDIELRDLKYVLDDIIINDEIDFEMKTSKKKYEIEIKSFTSDRLLQKIDAYNQKKSLNDSKQSLLEEDNEELEETDENNGTVIENGNGNGNGKKKKAFVPIAISKEGLELIELISLDCTNSEGIWKSDHELKIDKNGYVILNGKKTKEFWNAKIISDKKPLRMKVRNIAGDETIVIL
jgi:adenine-specific DNA-methyltransferase